MQAFSSELKSEYSSSSSPWKPRRSRSSLSTTRALRNGIRQQKFSRARHANSNTSCAPITLGVIGAQEVFEFACRARENFCCRMPFRKARVVDSDDLERRGFQGLLLLEYSDFSSLEKACIVAIHPEMHYRRCRTAA